MLAIHIYTCKTLTRYPWFLKVYMAYPLSIHRADAARYLILHSFGGIYADLDVESLDSMDELIKKKGLSAVLSYRIGDCKDCEVGLYVDIKLGLFGH